MCVIICNVEGRAVSHWRLQRAADLNPHGLGVVWLDNMEVERLTSEKWWVLAANEGRPYVAHFRWATVGKVCQQNTHPFVFGGDKLLMANGTIPFFGNEEVCDTRDFADYLTEDFQKELEAIKTVRFAVVNTKRRKVRLYNKSQWVIRDGVWYSNDRLFPKVKPRYAAEHTVAVYGTLKRGRGNHRLLAEADYVGQGQTADKFPMIVEGLPYVMESPGEGHQITVEVYRVNDAQLRGLDRLEGHPTFYERRRTDVVVDGKLVDAWMYFIVGGFDYHPKELVSCY